MSKAVIKIITGSIILALMAGLLPSSLVAKTQALSGSEFRAGRIIDDPIFSNTNSMSVADIQKLLDDLLASNGTRDGVTGLCDSTGAQTSEFGGGTRAAYGASRGNPTPFTCLKDYYENPTTKANNYGGVPIPDGAVSAAQLIWDAGNAYRISPQVLLVTLQKEQRLLSDDWPFKNQFLYAMGAQCPDSGPNNSANCDPAYAGFGVQMKEAARLYRYYLDNMNQPWWTYKKPGTNAIRFSPTDACGSSNVYIEDSSTAALYTYTPYQPNTAALSNLYGTGDSCSAYGNRNFWRMYNDWFGSSIGCPDVDTNLVYRLFRKSDGDFLYTQNPAEICNAVQYASYTLEGAVFANDVAPTDTGARSVFRLSRKGIHMFTTDPAERDAAMQQYGYTYEGVAYYVSTVAGTKYQIFRLSRNGRYFFTASTFEKDALQSSGFSYEGSQYYGNSSAAKIPIFRLSKNGLHLYTSSAAERDIAISQFGFANEGTAFYGLTGQTGDNLMVYRLERNKHYLNTILPAEKDIALRSSYNEQTSYFYEYPPNYATTIPVYRLVNTDGDYLLTTNTTERDNAVSLYGYRLEGIGFNSPTP